MKMNVLIVEDDPAMRVYIKATLLNSSFDVQHIFEADNGQEGYEKLQMQNVNLILTDISMPVMNGIQFLERVSNHPIYRDIPAVAVTTEKDQSLMTMLSYWGHGYVQKPFNLAMLEQEITKMSKQTHEYYVYG
ncbi:MAG: response regulator [Balneolaceae bacterium]|nr:response regulator [Balneolaceae bacterium]